MRIPAGLIEWRIACKRAGGRKLYAKRKSTVETTFGIVKSAIGFRSFLLRGAKKLLLSGSWTAQLITSNACEAWSRRVQKPERWQKRSRSGADFSLFAGTRITIVICCHTKSHANPTHS
jgi:hypothetical protein